MMSRESTSRAQAVPNYPQNGALVPFDFQSPTRVVYGCGAIDRLGELARELGGRRVLVVSDKGIAKAGHIERAAKSLAAAGLAAAVFDEVQENPTTRDVDACVIAAKKHAADLLVGLGGGSSMDTAKGANFLLTSGGKMADYWGLGKAKNPMLPLIAIPTTAGTGSEAQSFALIADEKTHQKMACGDKRAACRIAILDPETTVSQPQNVAAVSGLDALSHALESYVTTKRNPVSCLYAREGWRLMRPAFEKVLENPADINARSRMLLGANYAGSAIENSMLGAAHSAANPLTAHYGITHGIAIAIMLPHVIRFNGAVCDDLYASLDGDQSRNGAAADGLAAKIERLTALAGLPRSLGSFGVTADALPTLAEEAASQWTARFNPRPVDVDDFLELYRLALEADEATA